MGEARVRPYIRLTGETLVRRAKKQLDELESLHGTGQYVEAVADLHELLDETARYVRYVKRRLKNLVSPTVDVPVMFQVKAQWSLDPFPEDSLAADPRVPADFLRAIKPSRTRVRVPVGVRLAEFEVVLEEEDGDVWVCVYERRVPLVGESITMGCSLVFSCSIGEAAGRIADLVSTVQQNVRADEDMIDPVLALVESVNAERNMGSVVEYAPISRCISWTLHMYMQFVRVSSAMATRRLLSLSFSDTPWEITTAMPGGLTRAVNEWTEQRRAEMPHIKWVLVDDEDEAENIVVSADEGEEEGDE